MKARVRTQASVATAGARPRLETERLVLRDLDARDAPELLDFYRRNRAFFGPWDPLREPSFYTLEAMRAMAARERLQNRKREALRLYLFEPGSRRIVGFAGLSTIVHGAFLSCFLGYKLDEEARGKGYMGEAVARLVEEAFGGLGLHRVEANVMPRNKPSRRLLERLGFELEGRSRDYLRIAGRWEDHLHYVRLSGPG